MPRKGTNLSPEARARQSAAQQKWKTEHVDRISVDVPKGDRKKYHDLAAKRGTTLAQMIREWLESELEKC